MITRSSTGLTPGPATATAVTHLLYERLPQGTGWAFTTGSVVTLLIGLQFLTGVVLAMYYVPSPALAYDSVQVHHDAACRWAGWCAGCTSGAPASSWSPPCVHMLRVFFSRRLQGAPRSDVAHRPGVLLVILGFSLSGYLLPWDQKAYWATTVTINVARSTPFVGESIANVMRGGPELGALTLGRWYAAHVFLLPSVLVLF